MKRKTLLLLFSALFVTVAARAQTATPPPAKSGIEDDPQFKSLPADQQKLVRQIMDSVESAATAEKASITAGQTANPAQPATGKAPAPKAQAGGCPATPAKKPRFRIPKALQGALNTGKLSDATGIDLDPNAKKDAPKDATGKPCPPAPAANPKPAAK